MGIPASEETKKSVVLMSLKCVIKNNEVMEDLDEDVYCSIAVTKYMFYLGFNGVRMNPEHPKFKPFIHFQFTTLRVNEVAPVVTAVVSMLIKF